MKTIIGKNHRSVRLFALESNNLRQSISSLDAAASLYLFGSRTDLTKRSGVITPELIEMAENTLRYTKQYQTSF